MRSITEEILEMKIPDNNSYAGFYNLALEVAATVASAWVTRYKREAQKKEEEDDVIRCEECGRPLDMWEIETIKTMCESCYKAEELEEKLKYDALKDSQR